MSDEINENNNEELTKEQKTYLKFDTKEQFEEYIDKNFRDYKQTIKQLENENKELKIKEIQIKKLNDQIDIFTKHILNKYDVNNINLDKTKFDYSNYDNLEKSILNLLETNRISYRKTNLKQEEQPKQIKKIYL